jgi:glucans biosynthesis protein C
MTVHAQITSVASSQRLAYADNLKTLMVVAVIVAHVVMMWTGVGTWVFREEPVREPLLSMLSLLMVIVGLYGLALFFVIAGLFTPRSLRRKGARRFLFERTVRLGVPMLFFVIVLSPFVEHAGPDSAGQGRGFAAFVVHIWWPPALGPTWFLGVLLLFSFAYAAVRSFMPPPTSHREPMTIKHIVLIAAGIAVASYCVRIGVPPTQERWHGALGQAPAWVGGFTLGVLGGERGWFDSLPPALLSASRRLVLALLAGLVPVVLLVLSQGDLEAFLGGGTWQSLVVAAVEGVVLVSLLLWLLDVFRRRYDHQGRLVREMSRAAYAAFILHQIVLVGLVLAIHEVSWPSEVDFLAVAALGVAVSFGLGALVLRLPGVRLMV